MEQSFCQSCGMPLTGEEVLGTEADGKLSKEYCKYCYENGAFHKPNETMEEMLETCVPFMVQQGIGEQEARAMLTSQLPTLKRWANKG